MVLKLFCFYFYCSTSGRGNDCAVPQVFCTTRYLRRLPRGPRWYSLGSVVVSSISSSAVVTSVSTSPFSITLGHFTSQKSEFLALNVGFLHFLQCIGLVPSLFISRKPSSTHFPQNMSFLNL